MDETIKNKIENLVVNQIELGEPDESGRRKPEIKEGMPLGFEKPFQQIKIDIPQKGKTHLALLSGLILIIFAGFFYLKRYSILFSPRGAVFGAGFTDVSVILPLNIILVVVTLITALIAFAYIYTAK